MGGNREQRNWDPKSIVMLLFCLWCRRIAGRFGEIAGSSRLYSATGMLGNGYELDAIAAVILGGTTSLVVLVTIPEPFSVH